MGEEPGILQLTGAKVRLEGKKIIIVIPDWTQVQKPSRSGKYNIIATTEQALTVPGTDVLLNFTVYTESKR